MKSTHKTKQIMTAASVAAIMTVIAGLPSTSYGRELKDCDLYGTCSDGTPFNFCGKGEESGENVISCTTEEGVSLMGQVHIFCQKHDGLSKFYTRLKEEKPAAERSCTIL